ncbi:receptor-like protein kinase 5 [Lolium rigidum]|uniref:receptor-like protein kinase 5 n=1 Tax=Lolium rigidum TaxID=89674 RepID=UPI001F5DC334|nr:receptor-like protein kinase 5 [Lolium rigidum]
MAMPGHAYLLLCLVLPFCLPRHAAAQQVDEQQVLLRIKAAWGSPPALASWSSNASSHCTGWAFVSCDGAGRVSSLSLPNVAVSGPVPDAIGELTSLATLNLQNTTVSGGFPSFLYNLTALTYLDLSSNNLAGDLPADIGRLGKNLTHLALDNNFFTGAVPPTLSQLKNLTHLALNSNQLTGTVPTELGELTGLQTLKLELNNFSPGKLPGSFKNLTKLATVWLASSALTGEFPAYVTGMSELVWLDLSNNSFTGSIPPAIWNLPKLQTLYLYSNYLAGDLVIDGAIGAAGLEQIDVSFNDLTGAIPEEFGNLTKLVHLNLNTNSFSGEIPASLARLPSLVFLWLFANKLTGPLPAELGMHSPVLRDIQVDDNDLSGPIPAGVCQNRGLWIISASNNSLNGSIPASLATCPALISLQLQHNQLSGEVPAALWTETKLMTLLLQNNGGLTGTLPQTLFWNLTKLYISNNRFSGALPAAGARLQRSSDKVSPGLRAGLLAAGAALLVAIVALAFFVIRDAKRRKRLAPAVEAWKLTAFQALDFGETAVLRGLADDNLIGKGGSGRVYGVECPSRTGGGTATMVAVKRIWTGGKVEKNLEREFDSEVNVLGHVRHTNIVKLLCCLSRAETKLLVYEYMGNGSLDRWLHGHRWAAGSAGAVAKAPSSARRAPLDWPARVRVAVGAARGLSYMHHECSPPVVHRDVKCSNILLDAELNAKVADFGLARMLVQAAAGTTTDTMSAVAGTFGYMAPECAYTRKANEKVDVYSFGVVLLELATGREAGNGGEHTSLAEWAWRHLQSGKPIADAADSSIGDAGRSNDFEVVFKLGVICTGAQPSTRPTMKDVLQILLRCEQAHRKTVDEKTVSSEYDAAPLLPVRGGSRRKKVSDDDSKGSFDIV